MCSSSSSAHIFPKEHLNCPSLWCRTSCKDRLALLHHVSFCPWLSDRWYWCPLCCRRERLTATESIPMVTAHAVDPAKETKLKRAVAFFKTLGHKRDGRSRASSYLAVSAYVDHLDSNSYSPNRTYELGDTSPGPVELDSGKIHELGHDVQCFTPTSPTASPTHYTPSTSSPQFWGDNYQDWRSPYSPPTVPSESLAAGEDFHLEARRRSIAMPNLGNHALTIPVSLTGSSPAPYELPASERFTSSTPSLPTTST